MKIATEVITQIDKNLTTKERILSAIEAAGFAAIAQSINHPVSSLFLEGLKD